METLNREQLKNGLQVTVDWISFTIHELNVDDVCKVFGWDEKSYTELPKGARGYRAMRVINGYSITLMYDGQSGMGVHLDASGSAVFELVRAFRDSEYNMIDTPFGKGKEVENLFLPVIVDLFKFVLDHGKFSRLDLALDDLGQQYFSIDYLEALANKKVDGKILVSKFRKFFRKAPKKTSSLEKTEDTFYWGSRQSEIFMRIYDKRLERKQKTGEDLGIDWVRWEIEFKKDRANQVALAFIEREEIGSVFVEVLNNYFNIRNLDDTNVSRCSVDSMWEKFVATAKKLRLFIPRIEKTLEEKENWFKTQVAPTLAGIVVSNGGYLGIIMDYFNDYLARMSKDMQRICDNHAPGWRMEWGVDDECVAC